jgi:hypothetical protein
LAEYISSDFHNEANDGKLNPLIGLDISDVQGLKMVRQLGA